MDTFFTPGPAALYPGIDTWINEALEQQFLSASHRSKTYVDVHKHAVAEVRKLFALPEDWNVFFFGSANEVWERLLQNCSLGLSYHFVNGAFSERFYRFSRDLHILSEATIVNWGKSFDFANVTLPQNTGLIHFTHNETSTGVMLREEDIYRFRGYSRALITVDMVSSAPYANLDWNMVDAAYFSVQKAFGLPAGLGVLLAGPRLLEREEQIRSSGRTTGTYHSLNNMLKYAQKHQTPATPNMLGVFLLGKVAEAMNKKGIDVIRKETEEKAQFLYDYFAQNPDFKTYVKRPTCQSKTVIVVKHKRSATLRKFLAERGLIVGDGYGKLGGKQLRIANFPATSMEDMKRLVAAIDEFE
ncbi:MAG: aminotransferase class V-fold PLP-dependent enzyme [Bacteroidia bacterium]